MWATVATEILASLFGKLSGDGGSKPYPPDAAAATFKRPSLSLLVFLCFKKQSLQDSYGTWLAEPLGRIAKSKKSFPHRHCSFLGRVPFGGPLLCGCCCCGWLLLSCLEDFLYDEDAAAVAATGLPPIAASRAVSLASTK